MVSIAAFNNMCINYNQDLLLVSYLNYKKLCKVAIKTCYLESCSPVDASHSLFDNADD